MAPNSEDSQAHATGTSSGSVLVIDHNHPLFLYSSDVSGIQIISFQLTGVENYSIWFRSRKIALLGRNKLGMVDGSCKKEMFLGLECNWERVNAIVLSWIMNSVSKSLLGGIMYASSAKVVWDDLFERFNKVDWSRTFNLHKEIATLSQGTSSVSMYYSKLKGLWEEFEALVPIPGCSCEGSKEYGVHHQNLKLFQFLMGLNDSYLQARSQILMLKPVPSVNQAYSMILSDESQRSVVANAGVLGTCPSSLQGSFDAVMYSRTSGTQNRFKKGYNLVCDFCKIKGHTRENCYKIIGYPPDFKFKKKGVSKLCI
uniref:Putative ovule protein n=1 Tax=Solanum chacoense TaxID=4108 RepID=A0A0V0HX07_SOLCH